MISIGLGDGIVNGVAVHDGSKQIYQPQLTPNTYMDLLQNMYHEHGNFIRQSQSDELLLRASNDEISITADLLFDDVKPSWRAIFERARGVGRARNLNGHFGIVFPLAPSDYRALEDQLFESGSFSILQKRIFGLGDFLHNVRFISEEVQESFVVARRLIRKDATHGERVEPLVIIAINPHYEDQEEGRHLIIDDYFKMDPHIFIMTESSVKWSIGKDKTRELPQ